MGAIEKLYRWFELPDVESTPYRCRNCDEEFGSGESPCPECGEEVTQVLEPVDYMYWGPHQ